MQIKSNHPGAANNAKEFAAVGEDERKFAEEDENAEENFRFVMNALKLRNNRNNKVLPELSKRNLIDALKFAAFGLSAEESATSTEQANEPARQRAKEFASQFLLAFDRWLDCVNDRLTEMKAEDVFHLIVNLARINSFAAEVPLLRHPSGYRNRRREERPCDLRKNSLTRWHIQSLETQFALDSRNLQSPSMYSKLMFGFRNLYYPQDYYSPGGYPTYQIIAKMIRYFRDFRDIRAKQKKFHNFAAYESMADACFYLSEMKQLLDRSDLDFYLTFFKEFFENFDVASTRLVDFDQSEQSENKGDSSASQSLMSPEFKYLRFLTFFDRTGRTFLNWQLNPDLFTDGLWSAWFKSVKKLLTDPEMCKLSPSSVKEPQLIADTVVILCATCFNIADQFHQLQYAIVDDDSRDLFDRYLTLWIQHASLNTCSRLHESVQSCQACIKAKDIVVAIKEGRDIVPGDCQLLKNPDLIDILTEKLGQYEQSKASTKSENKPENEEYRSRDASEPNDQSESTMRSTMGDDDSFSGFDQSESRFRSRPASSSSSANSRRRWPASVERKFRHDDWKMEKF